MQTAALACEDGAAIFFDVAAAFPSVGQDFLLDVLADSGIPAGPLQYFKSLYAQSRCRLVIAGEEHEGFPVTAGIRQGCPLSPLLFAVAADLLLRRLGRALPDAVRRACADDLAVVTKSGAADAGTLEPIFGDYAALSGLRLNVGKTVWVPLRLGDPEGTRQEVAARAPAWCGLRFAHRAKYLGFLFGPDRGELGWAAASAKFLQRARARGRSGGGMLANTIGYSAYAFSTMSFLVQLDAPPSNWRQLESAALQSLYVGPGRWAPAAALHGLPLLGFPTRLPDLHSTAMAAKYRACPWEAAAEGGLHVAARAAGLRSTRLDASASLARLGRWSSWFDSAFLLQLDDARKYFLQRGMGQRGVALAAGTSDPALLKKVWQRTCALGRA
eukprot:149529-Pyramimonas_sp.AAC.1